MRNVNLLLVLNIGDRMSGNQCLAFVRIGKKQAIRILPDNSANKDITSQ